jgi:hypothetical protein
LTFDLRHFGLTPIPGNDCRLLVNEAMRLMLAEELFTFVTAAPVKQPNGETQPVRGTNNEAERTLRSAAEARKTGRTSKTLAGARRQTILTSVLQSLRLYLPTFTLASVIAEDRSLDRERTKLLHEAPEKAQASPARHIRSRSPSSPAPTKRLTAVCRTFSHSLPSATTPN